MGWSLDWKDALKVYNIVGGSPEQRWAFNTGYYITVNDMMSSAGGMALSDDKHFLAIYSDERQRLNLYDLTNGQERLVFDTFGPEVRGLKFSPNNRFLAIAHGKRVSIVDLRQATLRLVPLEKIPAEGRGVYAHRPPPRGNG